MDTTEPVVDLCMVQLGPELHHRDRSRRTLLYAHHRHEPPPAHVSVSNAETPHSACCFLKAFKSRRASVRSDQRLRATSIILHCEPYATSPSSDTPTLRPQGYQKSTSIATRAHQSLILNCLVSMLPSPVTQTIAHVEPRDFPAAFEQLSQDSVACLTNIVPKRTSKHNPRKFAYTLLGQPWLGTKLPSSMSARAESYQRDRQA